MTSTGNLPREPMPKRGGPHAVRLIHEGAAPASPATELRRIAPGGAIAAMLIAVPGTALALLYAIAMTVEGFDVRDGLVVKSILLSATWGLVIVAATPIVRYTWMANRQWPRRKDETSWPAVATGSAFLGGLVGFVAIFRANLALDRYEPDIVAAGAAFLTATAVALGGTLVASVQLLRKRGHWTVLPAGAALAIVYLLPAFVVAASYGKAAGKYGSGFAILWALFLLLCIAGAMALDAWMASQVSRRQAGATVSAHALGFALAAAAVALWMFATLADQAEQARQVNRSSAPALVLLAVLLLLSASWARSRTAT